MKEPLAYHSIDWDPWPGQEVWVCARWSAEYGYWAAGHLSYERAEALDWLARRRQRDPDTPWRIVRETRTYTIEED